MERFDKAIALLALCLLMAVCLPLNVLQAKKPGGGEGGGGGGGGANYDLIVLAPPGADLIASYAGDLNASENVVGFYENSIGERIGFYFDSAQNNYLVFGSGIRPAGLNISGEMVGLDENTGEGLYWRSPYDPLPIALSPLPGHTACAAFRLNDAGVIVGSSVADESPVAVAWKIQGDGTVSEPILLPFPIGDVRGSTTELAELDSNGMCRVVGYSGAVDLYETGLQWDLGVGNDGQLVLVSGPADVGSLGGSLTAAFGINFAGDIVGESGGWPFAKPLGQPLLPLRGIRKATWGYAQGINDGGTIVGIMGYLSKGAPVDKAVVWTNPSTVVDLNSQVSLASSEKLEAAFRINNDGSILALGFFPGVSALGDVSCLLIPKN